jgi:hypothetical protein
MLEGTSVSKLVSKKQSKQATVLKTNSELALLTGTWGITEAAELLFHLFLSACSDARKNLDACGTRLPGFLEQSQFLWDYGSVVYVVEEIAEGAAVFDRGVGALPPKGQHLRHQSDLYS